MRAFLRLPVLVAQEPAGVHRKFLPRPHVAHRIPLVIRVHRRLSTVLCTGCPQAGRSAVATAQSTCPPQEASQPAANGLPAGREREPPRLAPARPAPARPGPRRGNTQENTIAPFCVKTYHGFMTTWQTPKRAGYIPADSSLDAALFGNRCGVVAV